MDKCNSEKLVSKFQEVLKKKADDLNDFSQIERMNISVNKNRVTHPFMDFLKLLSKFSSISNSQLKY